MLKKLFIPQNFTPLKTFHMYLPTSLNVSFVILSLENPPEILLLKLTLTRMSGNLKFILVALVTAAAAFPLLLHQES